MNNTDKALLVKELRELCSSLEHQNLTLFETVRNKKRLQDICALFQDSSLEKFLPENLHEHEIKVHSAGPIAQPLEENIQEVEPVSENVVSESITTEAIHEEVTEPSTLEHNEPSSDTHSLNTQTTNIQTVEETPPTDSDSTHLITTIRVGHTDLPVHTVPALAAQSIYQSQISTALCSVLIQSQLNEPITSALVYLTEQYSESGFHQYLACINVHQEDTINSLLSEYAAHQNCKIGAIRKCLITKFEAALSDNDALYECFTQAQPICPEHIAEISYIPKHLVNRKKFILFEEAEAEANSPLLFLEERGKNRLICGENRIDFNPQENFLPFIRYKRQQGLSWQIIQETINALPQPIVTSDLVKALNIIVNIT